MKRDTPTPAKQTRGPWRLAARCGISVLLAVLLLALLEGVLALAGVEPLRFAEDPYVGFAGRYPLFIEERDVDGRATPYRVTAPAKLTYFNHQRFLKEKPENGYRVFCLGGSTTFGLMTTTWAPSPGNVTLASALPP